MDNTHIQKVVRYLRDFDASDEEPDAYEVEVFLRYFEELGTYLKRKSLSPEYAHTFFSFYIKQLYNTDKGKKLINKINNEDKKLKYLQLFMKRIEEYEDKHKYKNKIKQ